MGGLIVTEASHILTHQDDNSFFSMAAEPFQFFQ